MLLQAVALQQTISLHNAAVTATANSTGQDITNFDGLIEVSHSGALVSGTTPTLDVTVQTSDVVGSGYVTAVKVDGTNAVFSQKTAAFALEKMVLDTAALKKFIRLAFVVSGTTPSFAYNANVRGSNKVQ